MTLQLAAETDSNGLLIQQRRIWLTEELLNNAPNQYDRKMRHNNAKLLLTLDELGMVPLDPDTVEEMLEEKRVAADDRLYVTRFVLGALLGLCSIGVLLLCIYYLVMFVGEMLQWTWTGNSAYIGTTLLLFLVSLLVTMIGFVVTANMFPNNHFWENTSLGNYRGIISLEAAEKVRKIAALLPETKFEIKALTGTKKRFLLAKFGYSSYHTICYWDSNVDR